MNLDLASAGTVSQRDPAPSGLRTTGAVGGQFLSFILAGEEYALDILRVQEIKGLSKVTPIPNAPFHVRGVMNLRGTVVPIIDLRTRFQLTNVGEDRLSVIIVVSIGSRIVGLVVDAVSDVLDIDPADIEPAPEFSGDASFIAGLAKVGERLVMILDVDRLLAGDMLDLAAA